MLVGRSDCSIIKKPTFWFPPPPFFKISFFFGPRPSLQKTNYKCKHKYEEYFLTTNKRQIRWLAFFPREMITNLTPCWHLVDTLLVIFSNVQLYNCNNLTFLCNAFLPLPNVFMQSGFSPVNVTKYFLLTFLMFTAIIELLISTLIFVKEGVGIRIQSNKPFSHNLVIGMLKWLSLIMITKTD